MSQHGRKRHARDQITTGPAPAPQTPPPFTLARQQSDWEDFYTSVKTRSASSSHTPYPANGTQSEQTHSSYAGYPTTISSVNSTGLVPSDAAFSTPAYSAPQTPFNPYTASQTRPAAPEPSRISGLAYPANPSQPHQGYSMPNALSVEMSYLAPPSHPSLAGTLQNQGMSAVQANTPARHTAGPVRSPTHNQHRRNRAKSDQKQHASAHSGGSATGVSATAKLPVTTSSQSMIGTEGTAPGSSQSGPVVSPSMHSVNFSLSSNVSGMTLATNEVCKLWRIYYMSHDSWVQYAAPDRAQVASGHLVLSHSPFTQYDRYRWDVPVRVITMNAPIGHVSSGLASTNMNVAVWREVSEETWSRAVAYWRFCTSGKRLKPVRYGEYGGQGEDVNGCDRAWFIRGA